MTCRRTVNIFSARTVKRCYARISILPPLPGLYSCLVTEPREDVERIFASENDLPLDLREGLQRGLPLEICPVVDVSLCFIPKMFLVKSGTVHRNLPPTEKGTRTRRNHWLPQLHIPYRELPANTLKNRDSQILGTLSTQKKLQRQCENGGTKENGKDGG